MIALTRQHAPPPDLRADYLGRLPEPQELFVEKLAADGTCWSIRREGREIGYAVVHGEETLVELHLSDGELRHLAEAVGALVATRGVGRILAKSFDATLLLAAFSRPCQVRTTGCSIA